MIFPSSSPQVLDTFPFGGGVTSLQTLAAGAPVVTLRGAHLRGRLTAAMLDELDANLDGGDLDGRFDGGSLDGRLDGGSRDGRGVLAACCVASSPREWVAKAAALARSPAAWRAASAAVVEARAARARGRGASRAVGEEAEAPRSLAGEPRGRAAVRGRARGRRVGAVPAARGRRRAVRGRVGRRGAGRLGDPPY